MVQVQASATQLLSERSVRDEAITLSEQLQSELQRSVLAKQQAEAEAVALRRENEALRQLQPLQTAS